MEKKKEDEREAKYILEDSPTACCYAASRRT